MKNQIFVIAIVFCFTLNTYAQSSDTVEITNTINSFAKAGDNNDVQELEKYLDGNYRIVMNRLFGSNEVNIMPRNIYLEKIKTKEYGGDNRRVNIDNITINGNTACAKVVFNGTKLTFTSIIILIKNEEGLWKLVNETPIVG
ncbi:nuclear transport factor 2 family protein [Ulvibacter antarcticus]|uniref:Putative lumazine-binding protein n=1 Tax=Ulvibacter antarcticus TaxID=442714 RepID=A0A3L9YF75_9FLAO|nr:nuclear transport factor 2 family protein [Ulvibacter antarcticus]RMA56745.1 putative lumazine-binding protein [Ulvibacter antarcticus]